jgi:hypothetical protein
MEAVDSVWWFSSSVVCGVSNVGRKGGKKVRGNRIFPLEWMKQLSTLLFGITASTHSHPPPE